MSRHRAVHVVVPEGVGDPLRPSGGNTYDRRLCEGLSTVGWSVRTREVTGAWPETGAEARAALAGTLDRVPDGAMVLVDGLVASVCPEAIEAAARRLRTVVLMHMPLGVHRDSPHREQEAATVRASAAVVTTSDWTRRWLLGAYGVEPGRVHVARPGVDTATLATGSPDGGNLLTVGAVTAGKGHDLLVRALAEVADLSWRCSCVGPLTRAPEFVAALQEEIRDAGLGDRLRLLGPRSGEDLDRTYREADVLVVTSRAETYGMVVTEALARGLPVLGCDVGGVSEALGVGADGRPPGVLVPAGDVEGLAEAVRRWLGDAGTRRRLRAAAAERRAGLTGWEETAARVARVLEGVAA